MNDIKFLKTFPLTNDLSILDIGARGGIQEEWKDLGCLIDYIPIDTAKDAEGENILISGKDSNSTIFYNTRFPPSSCTIRAKEKFLKRFSELMNLNLEIISKERKKSLTIDSYLKQKNLSNINFLKLDTEGNEHHILEGATDLLSSDSLFAVKSEVILGPLKDPNEFSKIDILLREFNFHLFDIKCFRYHRNSLPYGIITGENKMTTKDNKLGQFLHCDVVYIKDPILMMDNNLDFFDWTDSNVLKLALIYSVYNCPDASIELLIFHEENHSSDLDFVDLKNYFTPPLPNGTKLSYEEYISYSKKLRPDYSGWEKHWRTKI